MLKLPLFQMNLNWLLDKSNKHGRWIRLSNSNIYLYDTPWYLVHIDNWKQWTEGLGTETRSNKKNINLAQSNWFTWFGMSISMGWDIDPHMCVCGIIYTLHRSWFCRWRNHRFSGVSYHEESRRVKDITRIISGEMHVNLSVLVDAVVISNMLFWKSYQGQITCAFPVELTLGKCLKTSLAIGQHCLK